MAASAVYCKKGSWNGTRMNRSSDHRQYVWSAQSIVCALYKDLSLLLFFIKFSWTYLVVQVFRPLCESLLSIYWKLQVWIPNIFSFRRSDSIRPILYQNTITNNYVWFVLNNRISTFCLLSMSGLHSENIMQVRLKTSRAFQVQKTFIQIQKTFMQVHVWLKTSRQGLDNIHASTIENI